MMRNSNLHDLISNVIGRDSHYTAYYLRVINSVIYLHSTF